MQSSWKYSSIRIKGRLNLENVKLKKKWIWDVLEIDWSNVRITLNDNKYRARRLLKNIHYYFMLCLNRVKCGLA